MRPVICLLACAVVSNGETPVSVNICELFANLSAWNGRLIRVEASLKNAAAGYLEGEFRLSGEHCKDHINVKGLSFPNLIVLTDPKSKVAVHKADFEWDELGRELYWSAVNHVDRENEHIELTVTGIFETREPLEILAYQGRRLGFGHLGSCPAQILVRTTTGITIKKNR